MESPLLVNVVVSKLLGTEDFGRVGEVENKGFNGTDALILEAERNMVVALIVVV